MRSAGTLGDRISRKLVRIPHFQPASFVRASQSPAGRGGPRGEGWRLSAASGVVPLFTLHCGSWRLGSPRLSKKGRVSLGRQRHSSPADAGIAPSPQRTPPPTVPPRVGGLQATIYRPQAVPSSRCSSRACCVWTELGWNSASLALLCPSQGRGFGPLLAGGRCDFCRCNRSKPTHKLPGR